MCSGNVNGKKIHLVFWIHWVYLHYCLDFYNLPPLNVLTSQTKFECLLSVLSHHYVLIQEVSSAVRGIILFANGDPGSIFGNFMKCIFVLDPRHGHVLTLSEITMSILITLHFQNQNAMHLNTVLLRDSVNINCLLASKCIL